MGDFKRGSSYRRRGGGRGEQQHDHQWRASSWKPPAYGNRQPTVPSWEKDFCFYVGQIPWKRILDSKNMIPIYKNVAQWDDSEAVEAFHNAKARYWAHINNLPCSIPFPDPDMYIDKVDWNCKIDPQLVADLEKRVPIPPTDDGQASSHLQGGWDSFLVNQPIEPTGWADTNDHGYPALEPPVPTGWDEWEDSGKNATSDNARWESGEGWDSIGVDKRNNEWGNWGSNNQGNNGGTEQGWERWKDGADNHYLEMSNNTKKRGGNGGSRNPNAVNCSRDRYRGTNNWRNCRGRTAGHSNEWAWNGKEHTNQWQWSSCGPDQRDMHREPNAAWPRIT